MARKPWFDEAFGDDYLLLYPRRDASEAERGIAFAIERIALRSGDRALDLCCGAGRHLRALAVRGVRGFGCDRSEALLARAARESRSPLVRADARSLPFRGGSFDAVLNFFHSFGYFDSPDDDLAMLRECARVLRSGGACLLDLHDPDQLRRGLVPESETVTRGVRVVESRTLLEGGKRVEKRIRVEREGLPARSWKEVVRLYEREGLAVALAEAGLPVSDWFGDFDGVAHEPGAPRLVALARKP